MAKSFESGVLLGHVHILPGGLPVRLRLARGSDAPGIRALLERHGQANDLEPARLVHFDPRRRYVVCATGLVNHTETLLGVGSIWLDGSTEPDLLLAQGEQPAAVTELLRGVLVACATARAA